MRWFISFPGMLECQRAQRGRSHTLWENNRRFTIELYGQHMSSAPWVWQHQPRAWCYLRPTIHLGCDPTLPVYSGSLSPGAWIRLAIL